MSCAAVVTTPVDLDVQVNAAPGSTAVIAQSAAGRCGCLTRTVSPTLSGPVRERVSPVMDAVQVGQASSSSSTRQTTSGGAATSTVVAYLMRPSVPGAVAGRQAPRLVT